MLITRIGLDGHDRGSRIVAASLRNAGMEVVSKAARSTAAVDRALDAVARATQDPGQNVFERVVAAAEAGATQGEIVAVLRREVGFGQPLVAE